MSALSAITSWLRRYGWFVFVIVIPAILGIVAFVVLRRRAIGRSPPSVAEVKAELAGIRAEGEAEKLIAAQGRDTAIKEVNDVYDKQKAELHAMEQMEAEKLREDPAALAKYLARAGARKSRIAG